MENSQTRETEEYPTLLSVTWKHVLPGVLLLYGIVYFVMWVTYSNLIPFRTVVNYIETRIRYLRSVYTQQSICSLPYSVFSPWTFYWRVAYASGFTVATFLQLCRIFISNFTATHVTGAKAAHYGGLFVQIVSMIASIVSLTEYGGVCSDLYGYDIYLLLNRFLSTIILVYIFFAG